ncbi:MAG: hypothetical protein WCF94_03985 [bacterium]
MYSGGQEKFNSTPEILPVMPEISLSENDPIYEEVFEILRKQEIDLPQPEQNYSTIDGVKFFGNLRQGFKRIYGATRLIIKRIDSNGLSILVNHGSDSEEDTSSKIKRQALIKRFWDSYLLSLDKDKKADIVGKEGYLVVGRDWNVYIVPKQQKDSIYGEPIRYKLSA